MKNNLLYTIVFLLFLSKGMAQCVAPSGLDSFVTGETTAIAAWFGTGSEDNWQLVYGINGFDPNTSGTTITVTGTAFATLTGLSPGTVYDFYVREHCGKGFYSAFSVPDSFTTEGTLSVKNNVIEPVIVFPNPSTDRVKITALVNCINIYDASGKKVMETNKSSFSVETLNNGLYLLEITTEKGNKIMKRLIKK